MNYHNLACWGDSQTYGARTFGCYPLYLAARLRAQSRYTWRTLNFSTNGHSARDLWFRMSSTLPQLDDVYQSCVLIGTNDVGNGSPVKLFGEYYRQLLDALEIAGMRSVFCGEIPPIFADGHPFFTRDCTALRDEYNHAIENAVVASPIARLVRFDRLDASCYVDSVHFNETGNERVADAFATAILAT
jgi:lysophospholipase L1-like esterase